MTINTGERPGVYSSYEASSIISRTPGGKNVGIAAIAPAAAPGEVYTLTAVSRAAEVIGDSEGTALAMVKAALKNGASAVLFTAVDAATPAGYKAAFAALEREQIGVLVCDSQEIDIQQALRESVNTASEARFERIAVTSADGDATQLAARAAQISAERVVLVGPVPNGLEGAIPAPILAAAFAGMVAGNADPSIPLSSAVLKGLDVKPALLTDGEVDALVRGGVTPIECLAGEATVVRAVTTRTKTGGVTDATWRELSTVLIADDVMTTMRSSLRAKFARAKNLAETREAVRSQATVELESKRAAGIIAAYGEVTAAQNDGDPTRCDVSFEFAVSHGMNQIVIAAHILV